MPIRLVQLFSTNTIKHPAAITSGAITRKHPNVKLKSVSTHLNYEQNENKNNRTITVRGTMAVLIGFVIAASNTKNGASLNEKIFILFIILAKGKTIKV